VKGRNYFASRAAIEQGLRISLTQEKELALEAIQCLRGLGIAITKPSKDVTLR